MMATLSDTQLDLLLREAEERLQGKISRQSSNPSSQLAPTIAEADQPRKPDDKLSVRIPQKSTRSEKTNDSAGPGWFNLPKTDLTSEFKRDWQVLRMRSILDPKHQMKALKAEPPKFSQVGEVIAGPTDYFTARLTRKEKGKNLLEEAMRASNKDKLRTKYAGIQKNKRSGKKAFYQNLVQNRRRGK